MIVDQHEAETCKVEKCVVITEFTVTLHSLNFIYCFEILLLEVHTVCV
jgi:hypothetical protein